MNEPPCPVGKGRKRKRGTVKTVRRTDPKTDWNPTRLAHFFHSIFLTHRISGVNYFKLWWMAFRPSSIKLPIECKCQLSDLPHIFIKTKTTTATKTVTTKNLLNILLEIDYFPSSSTQSLPNGEGGRTLDLLKWLISPQKMTMTTLSFLLSTRVYHLNHHPHHILHDRLHQVLSFLHLLHPLPPRVRQTCLPRPLLLPFILKWLIMRSQLFTKAQRARYI